MASSKILVLAGGSVKGAFQTGVIKAVFEAGFAPNAIYGVSAGSMNAAFLVNEIGKQKGKNKKIDFNKAANKLVDFWKTNITSPGSLARRRGTYELGLSAIRKNFEGLLDTTPLKEILHQNISVENLKASPISLKVGAVDIIQGGIFYADPNTEHFLDFVMASSAIPILMPVVNIGGNKHHAFLDGGMRDVAPIRRAIYDGADEIVCIACHTKEIEGGYFPYGNLLALVDRTMDIAVNECLNNDLDWVEFFNAVLPNDGSVSMEDGPLKGKRKIKLTIIRPLSSLMVDIQNFDELDIERVIDIGYEIGQKAMQK